MTYYSLNQHRETRKTLCLAGFEPVSLLFFFIYTIHKIYTVHMGLEINQIIWFTGVRGHCIPQHMCQSGVLG